MDGSFWDTERLSNLLCKEAMSVMGFPLKISRWRQISAALARVYVIPMANIMNETKKLEEVIMARQRGHSIQTSRDVYGVDMEGVLELNDESMNEERKASFFWMAFLKAIESLPDWLVKPNTLFAGIDVERMSTMMFYEIY